MQTQPSSSASATTKQQQGFSSMLLSMFRPNAAPEPNIPRVTSIEMARPLAVQPGEMTVFKDVMEMGVGNNLVTLTLSEQGFKTERIDSLGKRLATAYHLSKVEWFVVDDSTNEILIQYHDFSSDDQYQLAFRSPQYRLIWDTMCCYLRRKGDKMRQQQQRQQHSDVSTPSLPSPGSPIPSHVAAASAAPARSPSSSGHHPTTATSASLTSSSGLVASRTSKSPRGTTSAKMPSIQFSPIILSASTTTTLSEDDPFAALAAASSSSSISPPTSTGNSSDATIEPLTFSLPPPPRRKSPVSSAYHGSGSSHVLRRAATTGLVSSSSSVELSSMNRAASADHYQQQHHHLQQQQQQQHLQMPLTSYSGSFSLPHAKSLSPPTSSSLSVSSPAVSLVMPGSSGSRAASVDDFAVDFASSLTFSPSFSTSTSTSTKSSSSSTSMPTSPSTIADRFISDCAWTSGSGSNGGSFDSIGSPVVMPGTAATPTLPTHRLHHLPPHTQHHLLPSSASSSSSLSSSSLASAFDDLRRCEDSGKPPMMMKTMPAAGSMPVDLIHW